MLYLKIMSNRYFFIPKNFNLEKEYSNGFGIDELFNVFNAGSATGKDSTFVQINFDELTKKLYSSNINFSDQNIVDYLYRPFDTRKVLYDSNLIQRLRTKVMDHMLHENTALLTYKVFLLFLPCLFRPLLCEEGNKSLFLI